MAPPSAADFSREISSLQRLTTLCIYRITGWLQIVLGQKNSGWDFEDADMDTNEGKYVLYTSKRCGDDILSDSSIINLGGENHFREVINPHYSVANMSKSS